MPHDARPMHRLLEIMARLRDPGAGCPWDIQQSFATIAPYTIEVKNLAALILDKSPVFS